MNSDDELLAKLNELADVQPSEAATRDAMERTRQAVAGLGPVARPRRWQEVVPPRRFATIAAGLVVVVLALRLLAPANSPSSLVFAQVQEQVAKAKTIQFVERHIVRTGDIGYESVTQVMISGKHLKRREVRNELLDPLPAGSLPDGPDHFISIDNVATGESIFLLPDKKIYSVPRVVLSVNEHGEVEVARVEPHPEVDFYAQIRDVPAGTVTKLADRIIEGQTLAGFEVMEVVEGETGTDTWTRTYWVDPKTKLPVRIEVSFRSTKPIMAESDWVKSNIVFDQPLGEALFSLEPPDGYKRQGEDEP